MAAPPLTQASLLVRLRDAGDAAAWAQFVDLYGPLIFAFGRRRGLQEADAADLTQEVLARLCQAMRTLEFNPARGRFRSWLYTITHNCYLTFAQRRARQEQAVGGAESALADAPAPDEEEAWVQDYRRRLFAWAADQVKAEISAVNWQAFWQTAVLGRPARGVAAELGMTVAALYMAKSRTLARIREQIRLAEAESDAPREVLHG
jgi:RNA polymerase sigma-70 factor (ECF subfamily)